MSIDSLMWVCSITAPYVSMLMTAYNVGMLMWVCSMTAPYVSMLMTAYNVGVPNVGVFYDCSLCKYVL